MVGVDGVGGEESAIFGEEDEDQAQEHGEEALVDLVGVAGEDFFEELASRLVMRCLEAPEEFVERGHDLTGQSGGDDVLVFAAGGEDGRELFLLLDAEEAVGGEEHVEGGEEGAARDLGHFGDAEGEEAAGFSARGVDQADGLLVDEQAGGDFGFA